MIDVVTHPNTPVPGAKPTCTDLQRKMPHDPLAEVIAFLDHVPGLTYAFACEPKAWGPNAVSAMVMFEKCKRGLRYDGPIPEPDFQIARRAALPLRREIVEAVKQRVAELKQSGYEFALLWQAFGEEAPHLDHTGDYGTDWRENMKFVQNMLQVVGGDGRTKWLCCGLQHSED